MNKYKYIFILIFIAIGIATGFTFTIREGTGAIVSRFGAVSSVETEAGLHFRLPWPIDNITLYDTRNHYMDSGFIEILTQDMINVILQSYIIWNIADIQQFHVSVGDYTLAQRHLNDLVANTKNGVIGNYSFLNIISTDTNNIQLEQIVQDIESLVSASALENFGINITSLGIKRVSLPPVNVQSIFDQMIADRQRYVSQYLAEGERDAAIIISEAQANAAEIIAQGMFLASEIDAETERLVAEIYGLAYSRNPDLFTFLQQLIALENSVGNDTSIIMRASESPFGILSSNNLGGN